MSDRGSVERWRRLTLDLGKPSPFGFLEGDAYDYRDAPVSELRSLNGLLIKDCDFTGADFSNLRADKCMFSRCIFDRAILRNFTDIGNLFQDCRFQSTDIRMAQIGFQQTRFVRCRFENVKYTKAGFHNAVFEESIFVGSLKNIDFSASGFWKCSFSGTLDGVTFRGNYLLPIEREQYGLPSKTGLHDVSFREAALFMVGFTDECSIENIILPLDGHAFLCKTEELILSIKEMLKDLSDVELSGLKKFSNLVRAYADHQQEWIVNRNDLTYLSNEQAGAELFDLLKSRLREFR